MSENIRTAKLFLEEFKNDIPREQQERYRLMIEALEELRKIEISKIDQNCIKTLGLTAQSFFIQLQSVIYSSYNRS